MIMTVIDSYLWAESYPVAGLSGGELYQFCKHYLVFSYSSGYSFSYRPVFRHFSRVESYQAAALARCRACQQDSSS